MQTLRYVSAVAPGRPRRTAAGDGRNERGATRLSVEAIRDAAAFSLLRDEWNALAFQAEVTPFQTFEWLFHWWNYFGEDHARTPHILLFRDRRTLAGIVPLFLEVTDLLGKRVWSRLRFMGCGVTGRYSRGALSKAGPSDFLDSIIHPSYRSVVPREFARYLDEHPSVYDDIELEHLPGESSVLAGLPAELHARKIRCSARLTETAPRLEPPATLPDYLEGLRPHVRRKLNQARRAISETPGGSIERADSLESLNRLFRELVALHQARWNHLGYPGLFFLPGFGEFQEAVLREFWNRGWIWCEGVRLEGKLRAVRLGFAFHGRLYDYLSGFDDRPPWSKSRPGLALLLSMVEYSVQRSLSSLEFLRGTEEYKFEMTSRSTRNSTLWAIRPGSRRSYRRLVRGIIGGMLAVRRQLSIERSLLDVQRRIQDVPLPAVLAYVRFRLKTLRAKFHLPPIKGTKGPSGHRTDDADESGNGIREDHHRESLRGVQHAGKQ